MEIIYRYVRPLKTQSDIELTSEPLDLSNHLDMLLLGPESLKGKKYPAKEHALRVQEHFLNKNPSKAKGAIYFISGAALELNTYSDTTKPFRQNRYFYYLSGVDIPGSHIIYNTDQDKLTLYLPNIDYDDVMWSGLPLTLEQASSKFQTDEVKYVKDLESDISDLKNVYTTDVSIFNEKFVTSGVTASDTDFFFALDESRLIKDYFEIELMRHAAKITDNCHLAVMSALPIETNEMHIHAEFTYHAIRQGSKHHAYDPICCSGPSCSTLHYVKNDDEITPEKRSILIDAGAEWSCYASDVTRCFPINGDWTKEHLEIYNAVAHMQRVAAELIKPGVDWEDCHLAAHKILIEEFLKLGIFKKEYTPEQILESKLSASFFPHGLGHVLGMETHDVAGNPNYDDPDPIYRYLRIRRKLQVGMVVTNEPGIYFSPFLLEDILNDKAKLEYINKDVLDKYWYIGGVRIEDDYVITEDGYENLTGITSDPEEISKIVKAGLLKKFHNVV